MTYQYITHTQGANVKAWVEGVEFEEEAQKQIKNIARMPFIHSHIAVMPDVHMGKGATIGSVIPTVKAIIPAAVGVDIGCGMLAVKTSLTASQLPDNLFGIRSAIEAAVPHGRTDNGGRNDKGSWNELPSNVKSEWSNLQNEYNLITEKHPQASSRNTVGHLGTLGTGNHFIEMCLDQNQSVWLMLHSGSRGCGNRIGTYFISRARKEMERWFINLPDKDLAYLVEDSDLYGDYIRSVNWAQNFAFINRKVMMQNTIAAIKKFLPRFQSEEMAVNCHHNYIAFEKWNGKKVNLTRKGAVSAKKGELGIIPGNMGAKSYIVEGLGNRDSFNSCSHGAGRKMSRTKAQNTFTIEDHARETQGVECRKDKDVLDETPQAYKDIDAVMEAQKDLVKILYTLKQVVCVKG